MSFPKYPAYKDSDIEWIGSIPADWGSQPMYAIAKECDEPNIGMQESNLLSLSYGRIVEKDIDSNDGLLPESFETYQVVRLHDIVLRLTDLQNDQRSLRSAIVEEKGIITSAYLAIRPHGVEPKFLSYLLRAFDTTKVFYSMGGGLRQSMKFSDLKRLPVLLPSSDEQETIAAFLDHETAKIDALVGEQKKLIALLKEKRQAVISHAVTKGLDPSVPMKDSGVEWLGEVPMHWNVLTLRRVILRIEQGWSPECHAHEADESEWGVLKAGCLNGGIFRPTENKVLPSELSPQIEYEVQIGDVLMSRASGSPELVGSTALVKATRSHLLLSDKIFRLQLYPTANNEFFVAAMNSRPLRVQIENALSGGNGLANNLPQAALLEFRMCLPPIDEQTAITTHISQRTSKLDSLITEAQRTIALLQERRTALISAAVTGQIDVRGTLCN
jgi:type I restriction enzyme S subunit